MCGIAGHFGTPVGAHVRQRMLAALARRGPDARHVATFDAAGSRVAADAPAAVGLVHTRLSIIDPRPVADQPMGTDDGALWIVYNGEVYGWQGDARALSARGVHFHTRSDTEFILRGYEAWGIEGLLPRLRGMFAFAIIDFRSRRVHVVRDRLGLKPVVYAHGERGFAFGSVVRSVLPWLPRAQRGFSADAIDAYLAHRYVPAPRTIFTHIARLPNAHRLEYDFDTGALATHRYWSPRPAAAADCGALLDEAIKLRLVADRPLGLFLSGGIDSGTIACRLAATGHRELRSFSAAFPGSPLDESAEAARTALVLGLPNERIVVPTAIGGDFAEIVATLDEPFADPSSFPTWYLARATERQVKVVLGGDGGDELFAGYKRIAKHLRNAWRGRLRLPLPVLPDLRPKGVRKALGEMSLDWESAYALRFSGLTPNQRRFVQPARASVPVHYWREPDLEPVTRHDRLLRWDFANYLPEYVLRKADLCTMAHGLELRAPLLDHRFVEAVLALPAPERFTSPPKRYLSRLAPELERLGAFSRKKRGFNPPLAGWLDHDLAQRLPRVPESLARSTGGQLDAERVRAMIEAYASTPALAEQILSLVILDESLRQLSALREEGD
ncbi:MAG: asparagine synthase (glutamine-hydrolyzing) [Burkholderiales bacterium]|nr:asparagine synthase (glutamine-hydrolyzing) [Burkholderiales bacterium]